MRLAAITLAFLAAPSCNRGPGALLRDSQTNAQHPAVIADAGPGVRATLENNPGLPKISSDQDAISLAVQELVSGTGVPTRGIGLWMTLTEMRKPGRKLIIHSASALLTMYGKDQPEIREAGPRQGTLVRFTIPA